MHYLAISRIFCCCCFFKIIIVIIIVISARKHIPFHNRISWLSKWLSESAISKKKTLKLKSHHPLVVSLRFSLLCNSLSLSQVSLGLCWSLRFYSNIYFLCVNLRILELVRRSILVQCTHNSHHITSNALYTFILLMY